MNEADVGDYGFIVTEGGIKTYRYKCHYTKEEFDIWKATHTLESVASHRV